MLPARVRLVTAGVLLVGLGQAGCSGADAPDPPANQRAMPPASAAPITPTPSLSSVAPTPPDPPAELPGGGRTLFPRYRLVGYAGREGSESLGRLGIGSIDARGAELIRRARAYAERRQILPVFELVATVATSFPADGGYRVRADPGLVDRYLAAARRHRALLLLNIQPGQADFLPEVKAYERWLREPDVGVALDPEWAVGAGQVPGEVYGTTTGRELDGVARYLSKLVAANDLPEKVLVFHQVASSVVQQQGGLRPHPGVVVIKSVDGIGSRGAKETTWRRLTTGMPHHFRTGFKLFFAEDRQQGALMTPTQVLALRPKPDYIMHE